MWQSDFPHNPSTFPISQTVIEQSFKGIAKDVRERILYKNVLELYKEDEVA
jgi:predicted TIM-barrel fold metal-dependent hydrolase